MCNFCSHQDPASDNEMHRVHQDPSRCSIAYETDQICACPHCEERFETISTLNNHKTEIKTVEETNISRLMKCQQCEKLFYDNADVKAHNIKVHEYGEYYNLYKCGDCGFMGGEPTEIEEQLNHRIYRTKRVKANSGKSYENLNISNGDVVVDDDSDADEDWEKTKEDEKLLQDDSKEDDFFYKCELCSFETIFDDKFKQHEKSKNMSKSKRKADIEANTSSGKRSFAVITESEKSQLNEKLLPKALYQCKECGHKARDNYNLTRHVKKHK